MVAEDRTGSRSLTVEHGAHYQSSKVMERWLWEKHGDCLERSRLEHGEGLARCPCNNHRPIDASSAVADLHQATWTRAEQVME